jgi:hypothetical protein
MKNDRPKFSTLHLTPVDEALEIINEHQESASASVFFTGVDNLAGSLADPLSDDTFAGFVKYLSGMKSMRGGPIDKDQLADLFDKDTRDLASALIGVDAFRGEGLAAEVLVANADYVQAIHIVWVLYVTLLCANNVGDTNASKMLAVSFPAACPMWDQQRIRAPWGLRIGVRSYIRYIERTVIFGQRLVSGVMARDNCSREEALRALETPSPNAITKRPRSLMKVIDEYAFHLPAWILKNKFAA